MLMVLVRVYNRISDKKYVISFFNGIKSAVVAILISTGFYFALLNWTPPAYAAFGIAALLILLFLKLEPIFLIAIGAIFSLIAG